MTWCVVLHRFLTWEVNNSANLLKSVNEKNELIIWGKIFIHKHAYHITIVKVSPQSSLLKKYICRSNSISMAPINIATMHDATLQSIWIENGQNTARNNCLLQGKRNYLSWRLLINKKYDRLIKFIKNFNLRLTVYKRATLVKEILQQTNGWQRNGIMWLELFSIMSTNGDFLK